LQASLIAVNIPSNITTLIAGIFLTLVSLWVGQNHGLMPLAASEQAPLVDGLFNMMITLATGLFILVQGALIIAAFRFRQRPGDDTDGPSIHGNIPLEILWTAIPAVMIMVVGVYSFEVYNTMGGLDIMGGHDHGSSHQAHKMRGAAIALESQPNPPTSGKIAQNADPAPDTAPTADLVVNVTGLQFAWIFNYPDSGVSAGELHVPVGKKVQLLINASDVIHAFWVPQFRIKQDAIPGRESQMQFTASVLGEYPIICAELCGAYHGAMKTRVIVQTPEEFNTWVAEQLESEEEEEEVALNPQEKSATEFLAPYAQEIAVSTDTLAQLPHPEHSGHHH